jgi:hypothetical protein
MSAERVVEAAVRLRGSTFAGQSHKVCVWIAADGLGLATSTVWREARFGFVTSLVRFVSRRDAWTIAKRAGQIRWDRSGPGVTPELHSEDLL